jgi:hypothetical protein
MDPIIYRHLDFDPHADIYIYFHGLTQSDKHKTADAFIDPDPVVYRHFDFDVHADIRNSDYDFDKCSGDTVYHPDADSRRDRANL